VMCSQPWCLGIQLAALRGLGVVGFTTRHRRRI
jgi:hypothetical protein